MSDTTVHGDDETGARIVVTYRLGAAGRDAEAAARAIALEQTVELPDALVTDPAVRARVVGRVESVGADPRAPGASLAAVSYAAELADGHLPQLLNLAFGNASLLPGVRVVDLELPPALLARFAGPAHGVAGLRARLGVHGRPLLATALKPRGTSDAELAAMAGAFAGAGGDIVKDDQNLAGDFESFKRRVERCHAAVAEANARTGRACLYLAHVAGPADELARRAELLATLGVPGMLACPMIMGLDTARSLAAEHRLVLMAHPALAGGFVNGASQGVDPAVLLGTVFRLGGADASIFPNAGGRFAFEPEECAAIRDRLRRPLGDLAPAWPCPAGGMDYERLDAMGETYGADAVFLIGGSLIGHAADLGDGTRAYLERVRARFPERLEAPLPPPPRAAAPGRRVAFRQGFEWEDCPSTPYKDAEDLAFKGVRRVELVGRFGEASRTDLRYFEVEPGGFSSLEKHLHPHIVIGARGEGVLVLGGQRTRLAVNDVAWVSPLEPHQLRNETDEPFGFFCIVDHVRDRPAKP